MSLNNCSDLAKKEIREDETRKAQSLAQFRQWISKHPAIKNYRNDDSFFLQFLRARKFNNSLAYELYESYFTHIKKNPQWHADDEKIIENIMKTFDRGVTYPLSKRDAEGRKIVLLRMGKLDPSIDTPESFFSTFTELYVQLTEDEDTQIAGFVTIIDFTGFTLSMMSCLSIADARVIAHVGNKSSAARIKCILMVNLPSFARVLLDVFKMALSEKLKNRLFFPKDMEEFKSKYIDEKLLPKELGGIIPESEMIKEFKKTIKQNQEKRQQIYDTEFDFNMIPVKKTQDIAVGSFRKLEID